MSRLLAALIALSLLLVGPLTVSAQDATPIAGSTSTIFGTDGSEVATVTVIDFVDPFEDYDSNYVPIHGYHFAMANIGVENTGQQAFTANPSDFVLVDTDGFAYYPVSVTRPDAGSITDFTQKEMSAGDRISGAIFFQVLNGATLQSLIYGVTSGLLGNIATFNENPPLAPGEPRKILDHDGSDWCQVAVSDIQDPFTEYHPNYAPPRGQHYVLINVTITNDSPRSMRIDPFSFYAVDDLGVANPAVSFNLAENSPLSFLERQDDLGTGATTEGVIGFLVFNDVEVVEIVYIPRGDRLITVATAAEA
jgi:Domain of unknown function (DUF4352)